MTSPKKLDNAVTKRDGKKVPSQNADGETAFEEEETPRVRQTEKKEGRAQPPSLAGLSIKTPMSFVLSIMALAGVVFLHFKIEAVSKKAITEQDETLTAVFKDLDYRLDDVEAQLAVVETTASTLRQQFNDFVLETHESMNVTSANAVAEHSAVSARLGDIEAQLAGLMAKGLPSSSVLATNRSSDNLTKNAPADLKMPDQSIADQLAVLIVIGLLSDDAAGRPLTRWVPALSSYANSSSVTERAKKAARAAIANIKASPPSSELLLEEGEELAGLMAISVNEAGEDASLFDRARASLGKILRLRSTRISGDDPRSQLARFDIALSRRDLASAFGITGTWNGPAINSLESWNERSRARFALDEALADLTAAVVEVAG